MSSRNLSIQERSRIVALHEDGLTRPTVRLWVNRFEEEGHVDARSRQPEHSYLISAEQSQRMVNIYATAPFTPTRTFAEEFILYGEPSIEQEFITEDPQKKIMNEQNKIYRVRFAREYRDINVINLITSKYWNNNERKLSLINY
ncbi:unnamed protein product [Diatraea saccharalis]|uniref:Uncharacterized protein n=1 Tax=Diatraea saccharalis TaxID=40085 RepID=A0A9N9R662_9NEOP|nr:unnamed protein product [Diatraea saccharalis]